MVIKGTVISGIVGSFICSDLEVSFWLNFILPACIHASGSCLRPGVGAGKLYLSVDNNSICFLSFIRVISFFIKSDKNTSGSEFNLKEPSSAECCSCICSDLEDLTYPRMADFLDNL